MHANASMYITRGNSKDTFNLSRDIVNEKYSFILLRQKTLISLFFFGLYWWINGIYCTGFCIFSSCGFTCGFTFSLNLILNM